MLCRICAARSLGWLFFVPGVWYSVKHLGAGDDVPLGWLCGYLGLLALTLWLRFQSGKWRTIELVDGAPHG